MMMMVMMIIIIIIIIIMIVKTLSFKLAEICVLYSVHNSWETGKAFELGEV
jgi:hypothetical protein